MMPIGSSAPVAPASAANAAQDAKLHKVSTQLEGVFVQQMYKAMRSTVHTDGLFDGGSGEEMFTGLMDEHMAADTPEKWKHGLSESIFRQLKDAVRAQGSPLPPESSAIMPAGIEK
jgi:peptidoglycan hydrolase FlgJ